MSDNLTNEIMDKAKGLRLDELKILTEFASDLLELNQALDYLPETTKQHLNSMFKPKVTMGVDLGSAPSKAVFTVRCQRIIGHHKGVDGAETTERCGMLHEAETAEQALVNAQQCDHLNREHETLPISDKPAIQKFLQDLARRLPAGVSRSLKSMLSWVSKLQDEASSYGVLIRNLWPEGDHTKENTTWPQAVARVKELLDAASISQRRFDDINEKLRKNLCFALGESPASPPLSFPEIIALIVDKIASVTKFSERSLQMQDEVACLVSTHRSDYVWSDVLSDVRRLVDVEKSQRDAVQKLEREKTYQLAHAISSHQASNWEGALAAAGLQRDMLKDLVHKVDRCLGTPIVDDDFPRVKHELDSVVAYVKREAHLG